MTSIGIKGVNVVGAGSDVSPAGGTGHALPRPGFLPPVRPPLMGAGSPKKDGAPAPIVHDEPEAEGPTETLSLTTASTAKAIDDAIAAWWQSEVHGSEISQYTPAYNKLMAILPKLAASLKGIM